MARKSFRDYFDKDLEYFKNELRDQVHPSRLNVYAMQKLRCYAGLYLRDLRKIILKDDSKCIKCESSEKLHLDHIHPISKGGKNDISNIQILCGKCNMKKGNRT